MGCDIHPYLEIKMMGKWVHIGSIISFRNYAIFGRLSGVRSDELEQFPFPMDMPDDAAATTVQMWEDDSDSHSLTVVSRKDLIECLYTWPTKGIPAFMEEEHAEYYKAGFLDGWKDIFDSCIEFAEDARVILWYDN